MLLKKLHFFFLVLIGILIYNNIILIALKEINANEKG